MSSLPVQNWINHLLDFATSPAIVIVICGIMAYVAYAKTRRRYVTYDDEDYMNEGHVKQPVPLKGLRLTRKQLAEYNCNRADKTYLVALKDVIYDVSSGSKDFGPGRKHARLPGTEISDYIREESQEKNVKYEECLNEWHNLLEDMFYPAGKLISDADTTFDLDPEGIEDIEEIEESEEAEDLDLESLEEEEDDVELGMAGADTSSDGDSNRTTLEGGSSVEDELEEEDSEITLRPARHSAH